MWNMLTHHKWDTCQKNPEIPVSPHYVFQNPQCESRRQWWQGRQVIYYNSGGFRITCTPPSWPLIFWEFTYQYTPLWQINCICPFRGVSLGLKEVGSSICSDGLPGGSVVKNPSANAGDVGSILGLGRSPGKGNGNPTPVFLPGESHGQRSLVGYSPPDRWQRVRHDWATNTTQTILSYL